MAADGVAPQPGVAPAASGGVEGVRSGRRDRRSPRDAARRNARPAASAGAEPEDVVEIGPRSPSGRLDVLA